MKKKIVGSLIALTILSSGAVAVFNHTYAAEQIITVDKVNYVSLQQMGKKNNYAVEDKGGSWTVTGQAVNMVVTKGSNIINLNGNEFVGQAKPIEREGQVWISSLDWANLFNLSLTHFDKVSQMDPVDSRPVTNDAVLDTTTYYIGDEWGNEHPEGIRKHGSPKNIVTPHSQSPIYESNAHNPEIQDTVQR